MPIDRRTLISTGLVSAGLATAAAAAGPRDRAQASTSAASSVALAPEGDGDQTARLQAAIDDAARRGAPLMLAAGLFRVGQLTLRPNTRLIGAARQSVLEFTGGAAFVTAHEAPG